MDKNSFEYQSALTIDICTNRKVQGVPRLVSEHDKRHRGGRHGST